MRDHLRAVLAWLADRTLGPLCEECGDFRARGWRTLIAHYDIDHADAVCPITHLHAA